MIPCPWCSGSRYLNDTPGLGPCVCCTPDNLRMMEDEVQALQAARDRTADLEAAADALQAYFVRWGFPARPVTLRDPLLWTLWQALEDYAP